MNNTLPAIIINRSCLAMDSHFISFFKLFVIWTKHSPFDIAGSYLLLSLFLQFLNSWWN